MPSFVLSNLGVEFTGLSDKEHSMISMPPEYVLFFRDVMSEELGMEVEINTVYSGGNDLVWFSKLEKTLQTQAKIFSIQIEYNLDYLFNPISRRFDKQAMTMMHKAMNTSLIQLYKEISRTI
jgi:hypothetical protein